jgi:transmembrane sensor
MEIPERIFEIARLIAKEKTDKLSDTESNLLLSWLEEDDRNQEIYRKLQDGEMLSNELSELGKFDKQKAFRKVQKRISGERKQQKPFRAIPNFMKYAAAVAVLAVCSYLMVTISKKHEVVQYTQNTILPGKQKAILITSNNQEVILTNSDKVQIIKDQLADIILSGTTLSYFNNPIGDVKNITGFNTLVTPRGGGFTVLLSGSTEVILNSGSKLKYPVVLNENSRLVELEGEAFFKVTKSLKTPFIVKTNDVNVTVYGTVFNVSAYCDESFIQATLVEGKVGVTLNNMKSGSEIKLMSGQQLTYHRETGSTETTDVNTGQFTAWTNGKLVFENEPIANILNIMSRWYNFNFEFKDESLKKQRFTLNLSRYDDVNKILEMISISSGIKFSIKGDSVLVNSE